MINSVRHILPTAALSLTLCFSAQAQKGAFAYLKPYPEAAVVLASGAILSGTLILHPNTDVVTVRCANDSTYTLPPQAVQGFAVKEPPLTRESAQDSYVALERVFRSFPLPDAGSTQAPNWGFYEQLSQGSGPILLLRREEAMPCELEIPRNSTDANGLPNTASGPAAIKMFPCSTQISHYLRMATGEVVRLRKPKHVLKYLPQQASVLKAYALQNDLDYANSRDLSFLINYANSLSAKPTGGQ